MIQAERFPILRQTMAGVPFSRRATKRFIEQNQHINRSKPGADDGLKNMRTILSADYRKSGAMIP